MSLDVAPPLHSPLVPFRALLPRYTFSYWLQHTTIHATTPLSRFCHHSEHVPPTKSCYSLNHYMYGCTVWPFAPYMCTFPELPRIPEPLRSAALARRAYRSTPIRPTRRRGNSPALAHSGRWSTRPLAATGTGIGTRRHSAPSGLRGGCMTKGICYSSPSSAWARLSTHATQWYDFGERAESRAARRS